MHEFLHICLGKIQGSQILYFCAELDKDLESYHMKNPNIEERKNTISSQLDAELDDYFNNEEIEQSKQNESNDNNK